jgi:hypothetical protein
MRDVWSYSQHKGSDLLVLLGFADNANETRRCWTSIAYQARKARMSERNLHYIVKRLVSSGELIVEKNAGPKGCNIFHVIEYKIPANKFDPAKIAGVQPASLKGCNRLLKRVQPVAPEPSITINESTKFIASSLADNEPQCEYCFGEYCNGRQATMRLPNSSTLVCGFCWQEATGKKITRA